MLKNTHPDKASDIMSDQLDPFNKADKENTEKENSEIKFNLDFGDLGDFFCEGHSGNFGNSIAKFSEELGISNATK